MATKRPETNPHINRPDDVDFWDSRGSEKHPFWLPRILELEATLQKAQATEENDTSTSAPNPPETDRI